MKLFVGFDMQNSNIRIMHAEKPTEPAAVDFLSILYMEKMKQAEECQHIDIFFTN